MFSEDTAFDISISRSMWRYRWLVLFTVAVFSVLGYAVTRIQPMETDWLAQSSLIVEDPRAAALFEQTGQTPARYVQNQVEILESTPVLERASSILATNGMTIQAGEIAVAVVIQPQDNTDIIRIGARRGDRDSAIAVANVMGAAYADVRRSEAARNFQDSLGALDGLITESETEVADLQSRISEERSSTSVQLALNNQFEAAATRLVTVLDALAGDLSSTELAEADEQLGALLRQFQAFAAVRGLESSAEGLEPLLQQQAKAIDRIAELTTRRDQMEVDAELLGSGVLLFSPALEAHAPAGASFARNVVLAGGLGMLIGAGLAYFLAVRRRTFLSYLQPQLALGAPLLAEIPDFRESRITSQLPVRDAPLSTPAEAFRFAAGAIRLQAGTIARTLEQSEPPIRSGVSLVVVSANPGDGKSVCAANIALAAGAQGRRVLVIDADFTDQHLTRLLTSTGQITTGRIGKGPAGELRVTQVSDKPGEHIHLLDLGSLSNAVDVLTSGGHNSFISQLTAAYDVVVVDSPPLLHTAYASTLVSNMDGAVMVIPHESRASLAEEATTLLELTGTPLLGYLYNWAPVRREILGSMASMGSGEPDPVAALRRQSSESTDSG